jgi:hypothetical protein
MCDPNAMVQGTGQSMIRSTEQLSEQCTVHRWGYSLHAMEFCRVCLDACEL